MPTSFELALRGPSGEPVSWARTIASHGVATLPPMDVDQEAGILTTTLPAGGTTPRTVVAGPSRNGSVGVIVKGRKPGVRALGHLDSELAHILRLDEDLSEFYALASRDPDLAWVAR